MSALIAGFFVATVVLALRVPAYRADAAELDERMSETERQTRDRILDSETRRTELAVSLLRREYQLKALQEEELHLALSLDAGELYLRHGPATLRTVPVRIGRDSVISAPDGRTWRFVRPVGERFVQDKEVSPDYSVPEWLYISRGEAVPPEAERTVKGGLGRYVMRLDDGTEIYSEPEAGPLATGMKPAAFQVPEAEMQAIFEAVPARAPVYIY
jgi:hypothetical protein